jgi:hypothetical protein
LDDLRDGGEWETEEYYGSTERILLHPGTYYFYFEWPRWSPGKG